MKKVLLICMGGMSSSIMANKINERIKREDKNIEAKFCGVTQGKKEIEEKNYDLYLLSPQVKMHLNSLLKIAHENHKILVQVPIDAYSPLEKNLNKLYSIILEN